MIAVLKNTATREQISSLIAWFEDKGLKVNESKGEYCTVLGLIGDTSTVDIDMLQGLDIIEKVTRVSETFKKANRKFHPEDTVVDVCGVKIGGGNFAVIAGPCSVESEEQIMNAARAVKACGATILRGGAFKPRTSPYDFQGLHEEGIRLLLEAKKETGLPICSEIMSPEQIPVFENVGGLAQLSQAQAQGGGGADGVAVGAAVGQDDVIVMAHQPLGALSPRHCAHRRADC